MRVDGYAATVVAHGAAAVGVQLDLDAAGMARDGLVHRVVERLGDEMMHRALVGAADIHAGTAPHRLEAFEHLDVLGGIGAGAFGGRGLEQIGRVARLARVRGRHRRYANPRGRITRG